MELCERADNCNLRAGLDKLAEGQMQMRESLVQLTEAFKQMDRLERRVDKVEQEAKEENKDQGRNIKELEKGYWKAVGAIGVLSVVAQLAMKVFIGI